MAFDWEHVEAIRAEQDSARNRRDLNTLPTNEVSNEIYNSPSGRSAKIPGLDHWEQMIQKVRTQLIDYIIEHGLVQGFEYDGINEPIKNGKIVLTAEMLRRVTDRFGYFREKETLEFIEKYLPEHHYTADENYVHTDNNFTDAEKAKLEGIADGAEVNKVISILFNGVESIDPETRVAAITITPADVKAWYEQNPDTNVFTDAEKAKLESINLDELSNKVEDITLDGETIVKDKVAVLTAKKIKDSYESNADTNAFTDADKALVEHVLPEIQKGVNQHEQRIDALEKSQTTQDTEIKDAKDSISELGDEVNSVAGRVTTLETSQKVQDGRLDALEASEATQDTDILQLKNDVKNAGKVDDVTVDGVSVVENKVAKIPAIPSTDNLVPYSGATKDVNIGDHKLSINTTGSISNVPASAEMHIGKFERGESDVVPGIKINAEAETTISGSAISLSTDLTLYPSVFAVTATGNAGGTDKGITFQVDQTGVMISGKTEESPVKILPGKVAGLTSPTSDTDAANKQYVDEKIAAIPKVDPNGYVPYFGADKTLQMGNNKITFVTGATAASLSPMEFSLTDVTEGGLYLYPGQIVTGKNDNKLRIGRATGDGNTLQEIEIADPTSDTHAATKKYVDDKFNNVGEGISVMTEEFTLPNMVHGNSVELTRVVAYTGKEVLGIVPYAETQHLIVVPTFKNSDGGFNLLTIHVTNISTSIAIGSGTKCGVNITLRPKTE